MTLRAITLSTLAVLTLATTACNTVSGAGEDIQSASREVEKEI
ncbi:entericidin A/B family lipoprotein [Croceibacterium mercuriale]|jgi:predicted small secreted protein|nr:entericidin A/B family lipoprotein [Croceibacterium mercuriale]